MCEAVLQSSLVEGTLGIIVTFCMECTLLIDFLVSGVDVLLCWTHDLEAKGSARLLHLDSWLQGEMTPILTLKGGLTRSVRAMKGPGHSFLIHVSCRVHTSHGGNAARSVQAGFKHPVRFG